MRADYDEIMWRDPSEIHLASVGHDLSLLMFCRPGSNLVWYLVRESTGIQSDPFKCEALTDLREAIDFYNSRVEALEESCSDG